jgi:hypothetical protein
LTRANSLANYATASMTKKKIQTLTPDFQGQEAEGKD